MILTREQSLLDALRLVREHGRKPLACLPLYPPLELLDSFGFAPIVLWNLRDFISSTTAADQHVQNYACSVARHLTEFLLSGPEGLFEGLLYYNACDTLRNLPEIVQGAMPLLRLHVPARWDDDAPARAYLAGEIDALVESLERLAGAPFSPAAFRESAGRYARMRKLALGAGSLVRRGRLGYADFSDVIRNNIFRTVDDQAAALEALCLRAAIEDAPGGTPVMISGILPPPAEVIGFLEETGLRVAASDIAAEGRSLDNFPAPSDDPGAYYAGFYRDHFPCTTLLHTAGTRVPRLLRVAEETGIRGFIFVGEKFCEYEYFEIVHLEKIFKERGIATLRLEFSTDDGGSYGSLKTRIEAFAELLG